MINIIPNIEDSTLEQRREYIRNRFPCLSDCDMCGLCAVFRGMDPENAYKDYIDGIHTFEEVSSYYR